MVGRRLEKWVPETDEPLALLEDTSFGSSDARGWDQFAANSAMYGVQTTFDEGFYTTQLDKTKAGITEKDAERIAREIERGSKGVNNRHMLEERGISVDDSGVSICVSVIYFSMKRTKLYITDFDRQSCCCSLALLQCRNWMKKIDTHRL